MFAASDAAVGVLGDSVPELAAASTFVPESGDGDGSVGDASTGVDGFGDSGEACDSTEVDSSTAAEDSEGGNSCWEGFGVSELMSQLVCVKREGQSLARRVTRLELSVQQPHTP